MKEAKGKSEPDEGKKTIDSNLKASNSNLGNDIKKTENHSSKAKKPRPGPKSKTQQARKTFSSTSDDSSNESDDIPDFSDSENQNNNKKKIRENGVKSKVEKTPYVLKRKKLSLSMADLEPDSDDENWTLGKGHPQSSAKIATRVLPRRNAYKKRAVAYSSESD